MNTLSSSLPFRIFILHMKLLQSGILGQVSSNVSGNNDEVMRLHYHFHFPLLLFTVVWRHFDIKWYLHIPTTFSCISSLRHVRTTQQESEVGVSGIIRRDPVPFLWVYAMELSDSPAVDNDLVQCEMNFDVISQERCYPFVWKKSDIDHWQNYIFEFGVQFTEFLRVDITTNITSWWEMLINTSFISVASETISWRRRRSFINRSRCTTIIRTSR